MKILFVVNEVPLPPDNGVRIVSHNAMQLMAGLGHELALAVLTSENDDVNERFQKIAQLCQPGMSICQQLPKRKFLNVFISALLSARLFFMERYRNSLFRESLASLIATFRPDVIHFDIITMTQYRDLVPAGVGAIASINDSYTLTLENQLRIGHYKGVGKIYRHIQYWQSKFYEKRCYPQFEIVHLMSSIDAGFLHNLNPAIDTHVVPNGAPAELSCLSGRTLGLTDIVFVAKLACDNLVNLRKFLTISWPIVTLKCPDAKLNIVGRLTPEAVSFKEEVTHLGNVEFKGYVADLCDAYAQNGIAIVPIDKNCGIINKALEGMAAGLAVVGFTNSFAGIAGAKSGVNCVAVEDYRSFGEAIVTLLENDDFRRGIQQQASQLIGDNHTWKMRSDAYQNMYHQASVLAKKKLAD